MTARRLPATSREQLRASDAERERTLAALQRAAAEGRLDAAELEERAGRALSARLRQDLAELVADIPPRRPRRGRAALRAKTRAWAGVSLLLVGIWLTDPGGGFWPAYPIAGWGFAVALQWRARSRGRLRRPRLWRNSQRDLPTAGG